MTKDRCNVVTLADGHAAWFVVGYDGAELMLNDTRLSKDMQAADGPPCNEVVAAGLPGPDFARHMLAVEPPHHTRLRKLVARRLHPTPNRAAPPRSRSSSTDLLDTGRRGRPGHPGRPGPARSRFRCRSLSSVSFWGWPGPTAPRSGTGLTTLRAAPDSPEAYQRAKDASDTVVGDASRAGRGQTGDPPATIS